MADERLLTYRSSSQNRQAESSRQSQRNIAARAQLSEDEREDQRERERRRSRATAREQYLRNIKDGRSTKSTTFPLTVIGSIKWEPKKRYLSSQMNLTEKS